MLRSLENRVAKLEEQWGRKRGGATIIVNRGETDEQALEKHFRKHPDDRESEFLIIIDLSQEGEAENRRGDIHTDPPMKNQPEAKPQGGPVLPGFRGNLAARPGGDLHKLITAAPEDAEQAEDEVTWPLRLAKNLPFESWDGLLCQRRVWFDRVNFQTVTPGVPIPVQPEKLDIRERRTPIIWKGKPCHLQNGWLFSQSTDEAIKI